MNYRIPENGGFIIADKKGFGKEKLSEILKLKTNCNSKIKDTIITVHTNVINLRLPHGQKQDPLKFMPVNSDIQLDNALNG